MTDPYKILGVSRDASDDDIKTAYRNLAKKYHPDNFADDEVARTMAEEKMKDINEAYDAIQNQRKNGYSSNNGSAGSSPSFNTVRAYINAGNLAEAEAMLNRIDEYDRGAEWHFLKGCVAASRGQYFDAQNYISKACQMDPGNMEYRNALNQFAGGARAYNGGYRTAQAQGCSGSDMCTTLLCADCCCECMGGDLIRCC